MSCYHVIWIPINKDGDGPCDLKDAEKILFEVWDFDCETYFSSEHLHEAIKECNRMNEEFEKGEDAKWERLIKS